MPDKIVDLKVGIGADLSKLNADLEQAEKKIASLGKDQDGKPIKVAITPDIDAKAFIAKVQEAVKSQTVKVKVDATVASASKAGAGKGVSKPSLPGIVDASEQLDFFEGKIAKIKQVAGNIDVSVKVNTNAMGEVTRGVISYTNALGEAKSETYRLVNVFDDVGEVAGREFQLVGESFSDSTTKAARFRETIQGLENTLNAFANKHADIGDQIGIDDLRAKFAALKEDTNAEVTAIQQFKNEMGAAKVKADEIYAAQRARVASERQQSAEARAMLQGQLAHEQALNELRSVSSSSYRQEQQKITAIMQKQLDILNQKIAAEKRSSSGSKQAIAAVQLQKATIQTTGYTAKLSVYAKDVAKQVEKARNNMAGMQGYARSTANIFKGIVLSQAFYKGMNAVKGVVKDAWELSMALNSAEAVFSGMLTGGQQQAQGLLEVLKQEAIATPFDLNNLVQATRQLTAYGIRAENLMYVMRAVEQATAASGDKSKMEAISRALGQMYTRGKVVSQEIIQLQEAGIAAGEILKEELGLPDNLSQDWGKLNIDANTAINAIVRGIDKRYGQALDNMAKTTEQKLSNMKESFALIAGSLTDPIRRGIDSIIDVITPKIERLYQAIQAVGLGNALKTLLPQGLFDGVVRAIDRVVRAVQTIGIVFKQIKPIVSAVMNALAWYGQVLYNIFISVVSAIGAFGNALGETASGAATLESGLKKVLILMLAIKVAMSLIAAASKIWVIVSTVMRGVLLSIQGVMIGVKALSALMAAAGMSGAIGFLPVIGILLVIIGLVAALKGKFSAMAEAIEGVGTALKNLGGGTKLGDMFEDMSSSLQEQIDAYNKKVAEENARLNNELLENEEKQTEEAENAAGATKKAMKGLMSFDEVYKLMEASAGGGSAPIEVEVPLFGDYDSGGFFDGVGGIADDLFKDLDLTELQDALGGLWTQLSPMLETILLYGAKMLMYFKQMQLYSKLMTGENKEQWTLEKAQTGEDTEQRMQEKAQTSEDIEQKLQEKYQTQEDIEQKLQEKAQTQEDIEQKLQEKAQTGEDVEQLLNEKLQTQEDIEQLLNEKLQTQEDIEQLLNEKRQTQEDQEQWTITRTGGVSGGTGSKGTAAALALLNVAQIGTSAKLLIDDFKRIAEGGAELSDWMSLFVNGLMMAVDVLQLVAAIKLFGGFGGTATKAAAGAGLGASAGSSAGGAAAGAAVGAGAAGAAGFAAAMFALPVAVGGILLAYDAATDSVFKYNDKVEKIQKARAESYNGTSKLLKKEKEHVDALATQYATLSKKESLSSDERSRLQKVTKDLVKIYPGLNEYVGEESGLLNLSTKSLNSYIEASDQRSRLDALSRERLLILEEEEFLLRLLGVAEQEELEAKERYTKTSTQYDKMQYDSKARETERVRALLQQNGIDLGLNEEAYAEHSQNIIEFQEEIVESIEDRMRREAESLEKQQDAYHEYYLDVESKTSEHHSRLNALSAAGYAEADLSMDDWLKGMTLRQEQEYELQENLAKLQGRNIPAAMLEELEAAGPQYSKLIAELANANADDLNEVVGVWEGNGRLARKMAMDEIGEMPEDARELLKRYRNATDEELEGLVDSYAERHKLSREEAIKELTALTSESAEIIKQSADYISGEGGSEMKKAYEGMGNEGIEGLTSTQVNALRAASDIADGVVKEIDSKSKDMNAAGVGSVSSFAQGMDDSASIAKEAGDALARNAMDGAGSDSVIRDWSDVGKESHRSYIEGLETGHILVNEAGKALARKALDGAGSISLYDTGATTTQTFADGIQSKTTTVETAFKTMLNKMLSSMDLFVGKVANALNTMLSDFGNTMSNLSVGASGKVDFTPMKNRGMTLLADGGQIYRAASGVQLLKKKTQLSSSVVAGEAGAEIVFPLENTRFIKSFADDIASAIGNSRVQQSAMNINVQMDQARAGAGATAFNAPTATEISDAIRSWFTPQMQSLHDVLEQDRSIDIKVPNTSNALWRALLSELKEANAGAGSRGLAFTS